MRKGRGGFGMDQLSLRLVELLEGGLGLDGGLPFSVCE